MKGRVFVFCLLMLSVFRMVAQNGAYVQGYTYAENNSGYISEVMISAKMDGVVIAENIPTNGDGKFTLQVPVGKNYEFTASKPGWTPFSITVSTVGKADGEYVYCKFPMTRLPGYVLEALISEAAPEDTTLLRNWESKSISEALVEVYNNTSHAQEFRSENHPSHSFTHRLEQGNQYTILIRKKGYYNKRVTINVNTKGCILCFKGIGKLTPGVVDNLTRGNTMGVLGANITLKPVLLNQAIKIPNIYFASKSTELLADAYAPLDNLAQLLRENPAMKVEIRSHTDSRGDAKANLELSHARAKSIVDYLHQKKNISLLRLTAVGMGETEPKNKCRDGVPCSEGQHWVNRRTEVVLVGIGDDPYLGRSLRSIMSEEEESEILSQLSTSYYEAPASVQDSVLNPISSDSAQVSNDSVLMIQPQPVSVMDTIMPAQAVIDTIQNVAPNSEIAPTNESTEKLETIPSPFTPKFNGFTVELVDSRARISPINSIFIGFEPILEYQLPNGHWVYHSGEFVKAKKAADFLVSKAKPKFEGAKIVPVLNGHRVN